MNAIELSKVPAAYMITADGHYKEIFTPNTGGLLDEEIEEYLGGSYTGALDYHEETTILFREEQNADGLELNAAATQLAYFFGIIPLGSVLKGDVIWGFTTDQTLFFFKKHTEYLPK